MEYVYLSNSFIELLQGIFRTIFEQVFTPILKDILQVFIEYFTSVIWAMWAEFLLAIFILICSLVDFVESIFNVFAGLTPVGVRSGETYQKTYLLDAFFQMEEVTTVFTYVTVMAVAICFIFTIVKTGKSISDMTMEDKNPVSKVLGNGLKAAFTFMLIPFLCIFLLQVSSVVTVQATAAFDAAQGGSSTIGTIIFLTAGLDADKKTTKPRDPLGKELEESEMGRTPSFNDDVREPYMTGKRDYKDLKQVKEDFHAANFNFFVGFGCSVLMILVLGGAALTFVRRIFEILLLYIVSPLFVSSIPLDDGAIFAKWRDLFVAKFFSGFGTIFSMKYYLLLVPSISSSRLILYPMNLPNGLMINNILKIFFIVGGAWAVYKSQSLIMQIINPEAAMAEKESSTMITGMIIGAATTAASAASAAATGGASTALGGLGKIGDIAGGVAGKAAEGAQNDNQAYKG